MSSGRITIIRGAHGTPTAVPALREDTAPSASSSSTDREQPGNPFAAPPKGTPERPWQPRQPSSPGPDSGSDGDGGPGPATAADGPATGGDRWSTRQPDPHQGGPRDPFGRPAGRPSGPGGRPQGPGGPGRPEQGGPRFDVTDPVQRRARYSLMAGVAGLFFGMRGIAELALLLGAFALYWGVGALRGKATPPSGPAGGTADPSAQRPPNGADAPGRTPPAPAPYGAAGPQGPQTAWAPGMPAARPYRPHFGAALCGTIAASLTLAMVAAAFTFQLVYRDYVTCMNDALTQPARQTCSQDLPAPLRQEMGSLQGD